MRFGNVDFNHILRGYFDGLLQNCSNFSALAMELLQSYTKSSILYQKM